MTLISRDTLGAFTDDFSGEVLTAESEGYDQARSIWNGNIDRRPSMIVRCTTATDVAEAIGVARDRGLEIAVRGGGHSFAGHSVCDDGLVVDLTAMRDVTVDAATRRARCGGGTTWADMDAATQAHGLAVPGGVISHTGVAGLSLGGGMGWLSRKAGLSCDNLVSARIVTAEGQIVTASVDEHPGLLWALRGGGGNFGVVTEFEFGLHHVGPIVHLGLMFWTVDHGFDALECCRRAIADMPDGMGVGLLGVNAPPAPFVPEDLHFAPGYLLPVISWTSPDEVADVVRSVSDALSPSFVFETPIRYAELQRMIDDSAPWGMHAYEKALYLDELTDDAMKVVAEFMPRKESPMSLAPIFPLGGVFADVDDDATAFGGSRSSKWLVNIAAGAPSAELLAVDRAWVRSFWDALLPHASGSGSYVNFIADDDEARVRASYGQRKYDRLSAIKATWDRDNVFHRNANIKPAGG